MRRGRRRGRPNKPTISTRSENTRLSSRLREQLRMERISNLEKDNYDDEDDKVRKVRAEVDYVESSDEDSGRRRRGRKRKISFADNEPRYKRRKVKKVFLRRKLDLVVSKEMKELEGTEEEMLPNYKRAQARSPQYPKRNFCELCGRFGIYQCYNCGVPYCSVKCGNDHKEKRCVKFR